MTIQEDLKSQGWHLSSEGFDACSENINNLTSSAIIKKALDMDLRDIGESFLPEDLTKGKIDNFCGPGVVQIQKIKNASAPKYEYGSGAPPLLRLLLTDGNHYVNCLQWGHWKNVNMETPPGTKLYLKPVKLNVQNSFVLLSEHQFTVLGGCVTSMVDKWELCRQLASHIRGKENLDSSGPPPWIPFGRPIVGVKPAVKTGHFKSLECETKDAKEDAVFKQQRQANIAQVSRVKEAKLKSFGGRRDTFQKPTTPIPKPSDSPEDPRRSVPRRVPTRNERSKDNKLENRSKLGDFLPSKAEEVKIFGYDTRTTSFLEPGMEVMAKYWEDNQYYRAVIHAVGQEGKTCVVHFLEYGNYEEVLVRDVKDRNWNAGPIAFQPAPRSNYEHYPSLHGPHRTASAKGPFRPLYPPPPNRRL